MHFTKLSRSSCVTKIRFIVLSRSPCFHVMISADSVLLSLNSFASTIRSYASAFVLTPAPPYLRWCRLKSPVTIYSSSRSLSSTLLSIDSALSSMLLFLGLYMLCMLIFLSEDNLILMILKSDDSYCTVYDAEDILLLTKKQILVFWSFW